ncbi:uncharacterized protein LOC135806033 isoform X1 [Sycon ciliatum]|uniref:uncharacterized protein LOC135806033 isoform X1 n=1 Tax=Sycon ciliatum TaxID=27933 RepID=UPI0031F71A1E
MGAETSSSPMVGIGMTSPANAPPRMCQTDADCSGESCQSGACVAESDSSGDSSKTIIIAVSVTVIVLLLVFVTVILLILRRVHAMPSTTHQTHVHVHSATSAGSYNDLIGKTQDPSKAYTTPRRLQNGVWVSDEPEDYTALERPDEPPTYTPLLKMPSGRPPPMVGTKLVTVQDESEENSGAAYAHAQVITQHEEPCYRVLELPPIKDIPPPVAKRQDMSRTLPQNAALGYAQLEKDKPVLQATRSMSVTSLHENKNRTRRSSSQAPMATSKSVKASLPSPAANQEAEKTWKLKATQQHEEV